jgi:hypothetical protein
MIIVSNPEIYLNKQANYKIYDLLIAIYVVGLKCGFDDLNAVLQARFSKERDNA